MIVCLFVIGLAFWCEPQETLLPVAWWFRIVFAIIPKVVTSSLCAIEKHFWSLEERLCSDGLLRNWAPFWVMVPDGCPRTITSLLLDAVLNTRWYLIWREIGRIQIFNFKLKADLSEEILNCHIVLVLFLMLTFASILKPTEARKSQKKYSKFSTKTMTMPIQNLFRYSGL